jgi:hypothetical protein
MKTLENRTFQFSRIDGSVIGFVTFGANGRVLGHQNRDEHSWSFRNDALVAKRRFDVFVVGDDWCGKYDYLRDLGVDVVYFPYGKGVSSTALKKRIVARHEALKLKATSHFDDNVMTQ